MTQSLDDLTWPFVQMADAFSSLVLHANLPHQQGPRPTLPLRWTSDAARRWSAAAARAIGLDCQDVPVRGLDVDRFVRHGAPFILRLHRNGIFDIETGRLLVVARRTKKKLVVLGADGREHRFSHDALVQMILDYAVAPDSFVDALFGANSGQALKLKAVLREERAHDALIGGATLLELPSTRRLKLQGLHAGGLRHAVGAILALALRYAFTLGAWLSLSSVALQGHVDKGRVESWAVLLLGTAPVELALAWAAGRIALILGLLLKRRLLEGTFRLSVKKIRHEGVGAAVAILQETSILENSSAPAIAGLNVVLDVIVACAALLLGPAWWAEAIIFLGVWLYAFFLARNFVRATRHTHAVRGKLTGELVDGLIGHRTRLVQEPPEKWHDEEDAILAEYVAANRAADHYRTMIATLPRLWLTLGLLPIFVLFIYSSFLTSVVIGLAAVILGQAAFTSFSLLMPDVGFIYAAQGRLKSLIDAGLVENEEPTDASIDVNAHDEAEPTIQLVDVEFEYSAGGRKILRDVSLTIEDGDRLLLEGSSGGGKTTLASLIAGIKKPTGGILFARGLDQHTLKPADWRRVVASAPQFHENHIFANTLAFNLLASRPWPARTREVAEAEEVCRELGLGPLLDKMPAGIQQHVGLNGWQLSHGERSRVFIARALLQDASLVILDESFAALDPETLEVVVDCVFRRAQALLVIAHR